MRLLTEIILAAALIGLAWGKSFKDRLSEVPWIKDKVTASERSTKPTPSAHPPPASTPAAWMWDPNRRSVLDTPPPKSTTLHPAPSSTAGSWMFDPNHRSPLDPPSKKHAESTPH
jgi:hypothetical protein